MNFADLTEAAEQREKTNRRDSADRNGEAFDRSPRNQRDKNNCEADCDNEREKKNLRTRRSSEVDERKIEQEN